MTFDIETYLNSLPDDTEKINVSSKNINYLPNLTRFKNLKLLCCESNKLTFLPPLNETLQKLYCGYNKLTTLPPLNEKLEILSCGYNKLTTLPPLNEKLEILYCNNNKLS